MAIEITSLSELDTEKVADMTAKLAQYMQEKHPEVELTRGVFHDLVLYFNGLLNAAIQENIDRVRQSQSLLSINADPTLADDEVVDQVLSNYNIVRDNGTQAAGTVTLVCPLPLGTLVPAGALFNAEGVFFTTDTAITILPPDSTPQTNSEKVLVPVGDGTYAVNILLRAATEGTSGNITRGTVLAPNFVLGNVDTVYASSDFIGGTNPTENAAYLDKLQSGLAAKTIGGRVSYAATIRNNPAFENTLHISTLGFGDAEQHRDQHSLFPISGGGKIDIYLQTSAYAYRATHFVDAVFMQQTPEGSVWQIVLEKEIAQHAYEVDAITELNQQSAESYKIMLAQTNIVTEGETFQPDIRYIYEGVYSKYQSIALQFIVPDTTGNGLVPNTTRKKFAVSLRKMPLVNEITDYLTGRDIRPRGADILVKAAVPCFTKISFEILTESTAVFAEQTIKEMKEAVSAAVSTVGFTGQLHSTVITKAITPFLEKQQAISIVDMFGRIRRPVGDNIYIRDPHKLIIPNDPERLVTGRTTVFLTAPEDVSISVRSAGFSD